MRHLVLIALLAATVSAQESRMASDFEIAQMKEQLARSRDFVSQLSGRLNLGDVYATRSEPTMARAEYSHALRIAAAERLDARRASDMARYSTATAYAGLATAKLGDGAEAFVLLEESIRYTADSAKSWNLYASAMTVLGRRAKATSAAHNAVTIAMRDVQRQPSVANRLDLAVYQYALAASLDDGEAERLLRIVTESLRSEAFDPLRREIARLETFEIYSTARGEAAAYLSLANRAHLRLGALLEKRGDVAGARDSYERVLALRTDDAMALAALARLAPPADRERYFAAAFDANPFSLPLIRAYQVHLATSPAVPIDDSTTGGKIRHALAALHRGQSRSARETLDRLLAQFPANETLHRLRREALPAATELKRLLAGRLTPDEWKALDQTTFTGTAIFQEREGSTGFYAGTIDGVPFRFSEPTLFDGTFRAGAPLRLTYRVLGVTEWNGQDALLLEPLRLEAMP